MELGQRLRALIFDFDGTLFHLGVDWDGVRRDLGLEDSDEPLGAAMQRLAVSDDPLLASVTKRELAALGGRRVSFEVANVLEALTPRYGLAVLTRNSRRVVRCAFEGLSVGRNLMIVGREDSPRLKPDTAGLYMIVRKLHLPAWRVAVVGDTRHDVDTARVAGACSIVVANELIAYQPTGADHYIKHVADLLPLLGINPC